MLLDAQESFFSHYTTAITADQLQPETHFPFKNHPQFQMLSDVLCRKHKHHILLTTDFDTCTSSIFLEALLHHCQHNKNTVHLKNSHMLLFNLDNALISEIKQLAIEKEFEQLRETLSATKQTLIIVITKPDIFSKEIKKSDERFLRRQLDALLAHPYCRLIVLTTMKEQAHYNHLADTFTSIEMPELNEIESLGVLKRQCSELESYHQVLIPTELLSTALHLSKRYLHATHPLEKTLLLIDSSAARLCNENANTEQMQPVLTTNTLLTVLSDWTHIPISQLQPTSFIQQNFTEHMQQYLFGQDTAINLLGDTLAQTNSHIQLTSGPLANFLFLGPEHSGKKTAATAISMHLFQSNMVYVVATDQACDTLTGLKAKREHDARIHSIGDLIQQTPYAIIQFEHAEKLPIHLLDALLEITSTGHYQDANGNQYDFRQAILILNAAIDKTSLDEFVETYTTDEDIYTMDLMQLVMSEQTQKPRAQSPTHTTQAIIEKLTPDIADRFPTALIAHLEIIPFLPLSKSAIEKMIRHKLKTLGDELSSRHQVELGYAPEVIRYLTAEMLAKSEWGQDHLNPDIALKQLYFCIDQALLLLADKKNPSNQLFLQLNETGNALRSDWLTITANMFASS